MRGLGDVLIDGNDSGKHEVERLLFRKERLEAMQR